MTLWLAYGADDGGARVCLMNGNILQEQSLFSDVGAALGTDRARGRITVRIGGTAPQAVPVRALPDIADAVPTATQETPPDALSGWARLRISGVLASRPNWDGVVVDVTDQTTHWIHVSAAEIVSFQGFATGRLITALGGAEKADADAADQTRSRPERLAAHLHAASLGGDARALTGHLIGAEIAAAKPYWLGQEVIVLDQAQSLAQILQSQGAMAETAAPQGMLEHGLAAFAQTAGFSR